MTLPCGTEVPALADVSHIFMMCPAVRPAVDWLCQLWARIAPSDDPVPVDARVLLLGDLSVWRPGGGHGPEGLWLHVRLLFARAVWWLTGGRTGPAGAEGWRAVVAATSTWLARAIRQDWMRVSAALPGARILPSWCVQERALQLTQEQFRDRWCINDVLAHIASAAAGDPRLQVHVPQ